MDLTYTSLISGHPLIKNANGTLRKGRWWQVYPDPTYFYSYAAHGASSNHYFSSAEVLDAAALAKSAGGWTTVNGDGTYYLMSQYATQFGEDYPYYDPSYCWEYSMGYMCLYSFSIPSLLQSRTIRAVVIETVGAGSTLLEFGASSPDYVPYPLYVNPWSWPNAVCGWRFSTSKPSTPNSVGSPHTTVTFDQLTSSSVAQGAPIIYDGSGYWTLFSNASKTKISTPSGVNSLCQGSSTIWLSVWASTLATYPRPSNYSRSEHNQIARSGIPNLWFYA